jgi:LPXTG-motif cell wall-anchored protein
MNYETHVYSEAPITRNADGTIDMKNTLVVSEAGQALGAGAGSTAAAEYMASKGLTTSSSSAQISLEGLTTTSGLVWHKTTDTGDSANVMMYVILLLAAASAFAVVLAKKKKNA